MAGLIKDNVNTKLDLVIEKLFCGNRIFDRAMSILNVTFVMNNTVKYIHPKLAHKFPALSDFVSDYQASRNCTSIYGLTPRDESEYTSPLEIFNKFYDYQLELEDVIKEAYITAIDEDDCFTISFLQKFMLDIIPVTEQIKLLVDKASNYNDNWMAFDHDIKKFIIL